MYYMYYIMSIIISLFVLVMNIIMLFSESDSNIFKIFGKTETWFCIGVSIILLIAGLIVDKERDV